MYGSPIRYFLEETKIIREKSNYPNLQMGNYFFIFATELCISRFTRGPPVSCFKSNMKRLEDERMEKKQTDSVQNRFTAYLMTAVVNKRISYMEQRNRQKEREYIQVDLLEKNHVDFDAQYRTYMAEQSLLRYFGYGESSECMPEIDSIQLAKCINRLKERERGILFARVFGELDFTELGEKFGMEPRQAEMAYYYIIRKLRKGMGVRKDEF